MIIALAMYCTNFNPLKTGGCGNMHTVMCGDISSMFSRNSEAFASECSKYHPHIYHPLNDNFDSKQYHLTAF